MLLFDWLLLGAVVWLIIACGGCLVNRSILVDLLLSHAFIFFSFLYFNLFCLYTSFIFEKTNSKSKNISLLLLYFVFLSFSFSFLFLSCFDNFKKKSWKLKKRKGWKMVGQSKEKISVKLWIKTLEHWYPCPRKTLNNELMMWIPLFDFRVYD